MMLKDEGWLVDLQKENAALREQIEEVRAKVEPYKQDAYLTSESRWLALDVLAILDEKERDEQ